MERLHDSRSSITECSPADLATCWCRQSQVWRPYRYIWIASVISLSTITMAQFLYCKVIIITSRPMRRTGIISAIIRLSICPSIWTWKLWTDDHRNFKLVTRIPNNSWWCNFEVSSKTRSTATAKSTAHPLVYFMTFIGRQTTDQQLVNHLYETGHKTYRIPRNNAKIMAITTFKVVQGHRFWYQSKANIRLRISH